MKAYESKVVSESTLMRDAVFNAEINAHRKKGKPFRKLWRKQKQEYGREEIKEAVKIVKEINEHEKGWIDSLYRAIGRKKPQKRRRKEERRKKE